jgi:hypothetical protein
MDRQQVKARQLARGAGSCECNLLSQAVAYVTYRQQVKARQRTRVQSGCRDPKADLVSALLSICADVCTLVYMR